ncbi:hypothetical protein DFA_00937 [Cavenderia fasciculata]|uniref:IPT/TIG domain-containing protein n=1 Tax=Cavenderia fasciculata TaxID=261658 RepID=F4PUP5_CACFS|nr:uncharacterized protein DFA_00937 [Cavenderia fasciculata]EGG21064.1 hypothetical protein DFA_00937 [Cavenderia fasciculata]|eukprot:XP_004358914.1 hypothetical protein DFA_00937 [Cavenderia fasciculata]
MEQSQYIQMTNIHSHSFIVTIGLLTKKPTDFIEFSNTKRIPKPVLVSTVPNCVQPGSPMVIRGDGLKPFPGMSHFLHVELIPSENIAIKEPIHVPSYDINPCCDKCIFIATPEDLAPGTYNLRIGLQVKKMDHYLQHDRVFQTLSVDPFEEIKKQQSQQQQSQQQHQPLQNIDTQNTNIEFNQQQQQQQSQPQQQIESQPPQLQPEEQPNITNDNNNTKEDDEMVIDEHQPMLEVDDSSMVETTTSTTNTTLSQQQQQMGEENNDDSHLQVIWSNCLVIVVDPLTGDAKSRQSQQLTGKRSPLVSSTKRTTKKSKSSALGTGSSSQQSGEEEELYNQIIHGDTETVRQFIEQKISEGKVFDFNKKDIDGFTVMHYACAYKWNGLVEYFIGCGADPNPQDSDGWTPLHWAIKADNMGAIHILLDNAADQSVPNYDRIYPVEMAYNSGYTHIAHVLHGENPIDLNQQQQLQNNNNNIGNNRKTTEIFDLLSNQPPIQQQQQNVDINNNNQNNQNNTSTTNNFNNNNNNSNQQQMVLVDDKVLEPFIPVDMTLKHGIIEKHNNPKFLSSAEKLGLTSAHRSALMEAFKSLRTLRYRLFWIMLSNPLFKNFCQWDSEGIHFIVYNSRNLLDVLGLYFGLRGSNSAVDWMSHLARRKSPLKKEIAASGTQPAGDLWTNLRPDTFNSQTNLEKLKDITSTDKKDKTTGTTPRGRGKKNGNADLNTSTSSTALDESMDSSSMDISTPGPTQEMMDVLTKSGQQQPIPNMSNTTQMMIDQAAAAPVATTTSGVVLPQHQQIKLEAIQQHIQQQIHQHQQHLQQQQHHEQQHQHQQQHHQQQQQQQHHQHEQQQQTLAPVIPNVVPANNPMMNIIDINHQHQQHQQQQPSQSHHPQQVQQQQQEVQPQQQQQVQQPQQQEVQQSQQQESHQSHQEHIEHSEVPTTLPSSQVVNNDNIVDPRQIEIASVEQPTMTDNSTIQPTHLNSQQQQPTTQNPLVFESNSTLQTLQPPQSDDCIPPANTTTTTTTTVVAQDEQGIHIPILDNSEQPVPEELSSSAEHQHQQQQQQQQLQQS